MALKIEILRKPAKLRFLDLPGGSSSFSNRLKSPDCVVNYAKNAKKLKRVLQKLFSASWKVNNLLSGAKSPKQTDLRWYIGK